MTQTDYLNVASDLRRAANWVGRNQREKVGLITDLVNSAKENPKVFQILKHFDAIKDPNEVFKNEKDRIFFAEQLLVSSSRLQNKYL